MSRCVRALYALIICFLLLGCVLPTARPSHAASSPSSVASPLLSFAVLSDLHVMSNPHQPPTLNSVLKFTHALRDLRPLHPQFVVLNGDLTTTGSPQDLALAKEISLDQAGCPVYPTMGNHEYYYSWNHADWNDALAKKQFLRTFDLPALYYDKWVDGIHLIFLSPEQYRERQKQIGEAAWLSPEQLHWFEKTLRSSRALTFVFLHQPLDGTVGKSDARVSVVQTPQLMEIASQHPQVIWFSGHSHLDAELPSEAVVKRGIHFYGLGSVYAPLVLTKGPQPREIVYADRSQSRFVEVYRDRIVIKTRLHHANRFGDRVETIPRAS